MCSACPDPIDVLLTVEPMPEPENHGAFLDGLLVVSVDQAVAAPFCASRLAEAGARVIKVERPGGDFARHYDKAANGQSSYFVWLNRGKESVELDFRNEDDLALLKAMIAKADIFIQNLAPGALARAGIDIDALREADPRLITCSISGYGEEGAYRDMKAYDMLIQAETGLAAVTGSEHAPGRVGVSLADIGAGLYAYAGILQALYERERTGRGRHVSVSLFDAIADWMTVPLIFQDYAGRAPQRVGLAHPSVAPYEAFRTKDGQDIVISIQNEREWAIFCKDVLNDAALADDPRFDGNPARVANRTAMREVIGNAFARFDGDDMRRRLDASRIAYGAINSVADFSAHPQLKRVDVETPGGAVAMPAPAARFDGELGAPGRVPECGEHTDAVRNEFME